MNEVLTALKTRRSIRKFRSDPVPQALLDEIMEAGLYAASGMDRQKTIILWILTSSPDFPVPMPRLQAIKKGRILFMGPRLSLWSFHPKRSRRPFMMGPLS